MPDATESGRAAPEQKMKLSLIVPTRGRPENLRRFIQSLRVNTAEPDRVEVVLVIDDDDDSYADMTFDDCWVTTVRSRHGETMGGLNMAGYAACSGDAIMLCNDDVLIRTPGWDTTVVSVLRDHPDGIVLVHVNDRIFQSKLCTFPLVTRRFCQLAGGICPPWYRRYRIDDHIYNVFNLLSVLGRDRIVYLPGVEFEHLNHAIGDNGEIEYQPIPEIHAMDTNLFDTALTDRKALAIRLAGIIDDHRRQREQQVRELLLKPITDSVSLRRPEFVRVLDGKPDSNRTRVTIGVVTADIRSPHARSCLEAIKTYTDNYDLVVLDNNRGPGFNHAREMNRLLSICRTGSLVLMDDDVFVGPGWLKTMIAAAGPNVGVVTPLHKSSDGALSYAGVAMCPDHSGHHTHALALHQQPFAIQTLCSAVMLIDLVKCGHLRFDESYTKYFMDIDYGLQMWEAGFQVICTPDTIVTHVGGATLNWNSDTATALFEEQRKHFVRSWIDTGRYQAIEDGPLWRDRPEMRSVLELPDKLSELMRPGYLPEADSALAEARAFFEELRPYPSVQSAVSAELTNRLRGRVPRFSRPEGRMPAALAGQLEHPIRLGEINETHAAFLWRGKYFAVPTQPEPFEEERAASGDYPSAATLPLLRAHLDVGYTDSMSEWNPLNANLPVTLLEQGYKGFNLIRYDRVYAVPQRDGAFTAARLHDRRLPRLLAGDSLEQVRRQIDNLRPVLVEANYKGFNLVRYDRIYGLPRGDGEFDFERVARGGYSELHEGLTAAGVRQKIDQRGVVARSKLFLRRGVRAVRRRVRTAARVAVRSGRGQSADLHHDVREQNGRPEAVAPKGAPVAERQEYETITSTRLPSEPASVYPSDPRELRTSALLTRDWYYKIELLPGVITPGKYGHATVLVRRLLEKCEIKGLRCLDIGPMEGMISASMALAGAASVTATDITPEHVGKIDAVMHYLGVAIDFHAPVHLVDAPTFFKARGETAFDLVVFAGVLYHVADFNQSLASARTMVRTGGLMFIETWLSAGDDMVMHFNHHGLVTNEPNTLWFPTLPLFDYLLRMNRLHIIDCVFYEIAEGGYRIAVACRAIDAPDAGDDSWMSAAGSSGVDTRFHQQLALTSVRDDPIVFRGPDIGTEMTEGTGSINLATWVAGHSSEIVVADDIELRRPRA